MDEKKVPPRIFVIFAQKAHEAVIFRRGPSAWYHIIRWDTKNDKFYPGAWVKGRMYPERCDLSPDGKLLLYFIHQGNKLKTDYSDSWNAISRSPWLSALGLWPQGITYGGGGRFTDNRSAILRFYQIPAHHNHLGEGLNINFLGTILGKRAGPIVKLDHPLTPIHRSTKEVKGSEWTGRDQRGRLIYATEGKIMCSINNTETICLIDLNNMAPNPQPPPASALKPLTPEKKRQKKKTRNRDSL